jgi:competence protein ComEC
MVWVAWVSVVGFIFVTIYWPVKLVRIFALFGLVCCAAVWWAHRQQAPDLSQYFATKITIEFQIITDPIFSERSQRFYAQTYKIDNTNQPVKLAVVMPRYPEFSYGDKLQVVGKLAPVSEFNTRANVSAELVFAKVNSVTSARANPIKHWLYQVKRVMLIKIGQIMPEPQAGLLGGLLLGTRGFAPDLAEQFRITGTSHIVAISGYNVTIVAGIIDSILRRFGRSVSFYGSLAGVAGLVIITGAEASVVRAGFMGGLVLLAQQTGRVYASSQSILFTAAVMLVQNPLLLVFDIGFQLSFAALAGLLYLQPVLDERLPTLPFKDYWLPTLAAQITTTPLLLYHFGNLSLVSMLANFLVLAIIPWAMLVGFVAVCAALLWPSIGPWLGSLAWLPLFYIITAIKWCAGLPAAAIFNIPFPLWLTAVYYLLLIGWIKQWKPKLLEYLKLF